MSSYKFPPPNSTLTILEYARFLQPTYLPSLETSISLKQTNSSIPIDPSLLRPNVLALERLDKWLPALAVRTTIPSALAAKQRQLALSAFAKSIRSTYSTGLAKYHQYYDTIMLPEINHTPTSTTIIAGFVTYLSGAYSKTAITNFIAGVKAWHLINNLQYDVDDKLLQTLLRGAARVQPLPQPRHRPLTTVELEKILKNLDISQHKQAAVAACLTTCFYSCA